MEPHVRHHGEGSRQSSKLLPGAGNCMQRSTGTKIASSQGLLEELGDDVLVLLVDLAAAQLARRRQDAVLRRPLVAQHRHVLDHLERLAPRRLRRRLQRRHRRLAEVLLLQHVRPRAADVVRLRELHRLRLVGQHQRADERLVRVDEDAHAVRHREVVLHEQRLERLHRDVLAVRVLRQRLRAPDDLQRTVGREHAHVARREPPVVQERLLGLLGLLVVALRDRRAADEHLAARVRLVRVLPRVHVPQLHLAHRQQPAHVLLLQVVVALDRRGGTRLGETVALADGAAEDDGQELVRARRHRRTTRDDHLAAAAEQRARVGEDAVVPVRRVEALGERRLALLVRAVEHAAAELALGRQLALHRLLDRIEDARDAGEEDGAELFEVAVGASGGVGERARGAVADATATHQEDVLGSEFQDVGEREDAEVRLLFLFGCVVVDVTKHLVQPAAKAEHRRIDVTMRHHHTLGRAGGTGRVHDERELLRVRRELRRARLRVLRAQLVERPDLRALRVDARRDGVRHDELRHRDARLLAQLDQVAHQLPVEHHRRQLRLLDRVHERVVAEVRVHGDADHLAAPDAVARHHPLVPRVLVQPDARPRRQPDRLRQALAEGHHLLPHLLVRQVLRRLQVDVLPHLGLAVLGELLLRRLLDRSVRHGARAAELLAHLLERDRHGAVLAAVELLEDVRLRQRLHRRRPPDARLGLPVVGADLDGLRAELADGLDHFVLTLLRIVDHAHARDRTAAHGGC
mmetsp:Transcript_43177/g.133390  ORF Transcript_43177/g.133390 Transcript_43177/m.133390 type:complete len:748 (-) Transcript_43177:53-2296(-)